jgi:hypothetical protein
MKEKPTWAPTGRGDAAACCDCGARAVFWNEFNGVVQCHRCGQQADHVCCGIGYFVESDATACPACGAYPGDV